MRAAPGEPERALLEVDGVTGVFERRIVHALPNGLHLAVMGVENRDGREAADLVLVAR